MNLTASLASLLATDERRDSPRMSKVSYNAPKEANLGQKIRWRQRVSEAFGPGYFAGITCGDWFRLLRDNRFAIGRRYLPRAASISAASVFNTIVARRQHGRCANTILPPVTERPLFILGHWRSGTSHLHRLLAADVYFAAPTLVQVVFPRTFLRTEAVPSKFLARFLPGARKVDNMPLSLDVPEEDERALCTLFGHSPYLSMTFPRREAEYDRYLTMRNVSQEDRRRWQAALLDFVRAFAGGTSRAPLLKSPPHTCRIKLLLEIFPGAKFVHIHRHPYAVFQSTRHLLCGWHERHCLQYRDLAGLDDRIVRQYREMYDVFFAERQLIPQGNFYELDFADLERQPIEELRQLYDGLALPGFDAARPAIERYLASVEGYKKNHYAELPRAICARIAREWQRSFEEWGYRDELS